MKKCFLALSVCAWAMILACKQHDDVVQTDLLQCPADPSPVSGLGGKGPIILPNAFSPNGDGRNDVLRVVAADSASVRSMTLRVVSAEGTVLYTFARQKDSWDGYDHSANKFYPAGKYRIDYGIVLNGGTGTDVVLNGHTCIKLYAAGSGGCLVRQGDPNQDVFEDQINPALGTKAYTTSENFCQ